MYLKVLCALMVAAIANPICCCTVGLLANGEVNAIASHDCCGIDASEEGKESSHEDCPHQSLKSHQKLAQKDLKAEQILPVFVPLIVGELVSFEMSQKTITAISPSEWDPVPKWSGGSARHQLYCVYRI